MVPRPAPRRSRRTPRRPSLLAAACGSMPAWASAASAACADPASPAAWRAASCGAGRRRRRRPRTPPRATRSSTAARGGPGDQAGVDVGGRPEDVAADRAGPPYLGVPGGLHRRDAVGPGARRGGEPVGDLGLHHHQAVLAATAAAPSGAAAPGPRRCRAGWRPARWAAGRAPRDAQRVGGDDLEAVGVAGARARRSSRAARAPARGSTSIATTRRRPRAARGSASRAGPTSTTTSSGPTAGARTIRRTVLASMTKFCPRCLVGRRSSAAASERLRPGESLGPAEVARLPA